MAKKASSTVASVTKAKASKARVGRPNAEVALVQIGTAVPRWVVDALDASADAALRTRASEVRLILEAELRRREQHSPSAN